MTGVQALGAIRRASSRVVTRSTRASVTEGSATYVVISESPASLASQAGAGLDVYSLARMVMSEDGSANAETLLCLAESARNYARRSGVSLFSLLTRTSKNAAKGKYSEQAAGKWASTRLDPSERCLVAARCAVEEDTDYSKGATDFFDPRAQDKGVQGTHSLRLTSEAYITRAAGERLQWVGPIDGINPYRLMLFSPASPPVDTSGALAVVRLGRGVTSFATIAFLGGAIYYLWR